MTNVSVEDIEQAKALLENNGYQVDKRPNNLAGMLYIDAVKKVRGGMEMPLDMLWSDLLWHAVPDRYFIFEATIEERQQAHDWLLEESKANVLNKPITEVLSQVRNADGTTTTVTRVQLPTHDILA